MEKVGEKKKPLFRSIGDRDISGTTVEQAGSECDPMKSLEDPPVDWYEPLEEDWEDNNDDAQSWNIDEVKDAEMESLAGESGRNYKGRGGGAVGKRKRKWQFGSVDGWEDCPVLGEGWKRKVVLRRSGVSVGQRDVYYLSPKGERVRSKIELLKYIRNTLDLTNFDFKTGIFVDGEPQKKGIKPSLPDFKESQFSDSDDRSSFYEDNNSEELLRKCQRSCGRCKGCVAKSDCGTCDYCIDKPKFGGSNKKRQKCRQRQCQREAMGWTAPGRPGLHYAYSLKVMRKNRGIWDLDFSDNECEKERITQNSVVGMRFVDKDKNCVSDYNGQGAKIEESQAHSEEHLLHLFCDEWTRSSDGKWSCPPIIGQHVEQPDENEMKPTITQIFSLGGDNSAVDGLELLELLASLRDAPLPMLWCAVLVEGPHLQLLQCSKLSAMADTMVQIEPSFRYHISVQGEPLLPTHRLYHAHPVRLTSVAQVAILLEDLERYSLCQGFKSELPFGSEPIVQVRAATCEFLVLPEDQCCARCKSAQQKH